MEFNSLGNNIKKYRNKLGLTQKELGEKILKSEISIRKYESGKINIPPSTLFELCKIFNITFGALLGEDAKLYIENNSNYEKDLLEILYSQKDIIIEKQENTISKLYSITDELLNVEKSWREEHRKIIHSPEGLLNVILDYLLENDLYYTAMSFPEENEPKDPDLPYFKKSEVKDIIEKVCNLVINEIDKIEHFNMSVYNKTLKITKHILENNNIKFNKKDIAKLYEKIESTED